MIIGNDFIHRNAHNIRLSFAPSAHDPSGADLSECVYEDREPARRTVMPSEGRSVQKMNCETWDFGTVNSARERGMGLGVGYQKDVRKTINRHLIFAHKIKAS